VSQHPSFTLSATVKAGTLTLDHERRYQQLVKRLKDGPYDVVIERQRKNRSRKLEKYLWGHVYDVLSEFTGYTRDELHAYCKAKFLTQQTKRIVLSDARGEVKDDTVIPLEPSTTVLDADAYRAFIHDVRQMAAELGCVTHDPDPEWMFNQDEKPKAKGRAA